MTNIGILIMNYSYISNEPLKEMAKLAKSVELEKLKK